MPSNLIFGASHWKWAGGDDAYHNGFVHKANVQALYERVAQNPAIRDTFLIYYDHNIDAMHYVEGYLGRYRPLGSMQTQIIAVSILDPDDNIIVGTRVRQFSSSTPTPVSDGHLLFEYGNGGNWYSSIDDGVGGYAWQILSDNDTTLQDGLAAAGSSLQWINGTDLVDGGSFANESEVRELFFSGERVFDSDSHYFFFDRQRGGFFEITDVDDGVDAYQFGHITTEAFDITTTNDFLGPVATIADLPEPNFTLDGKFYYVVANTTFYNLRTTDGGATYFWGIDVSNASRPLWIRDADTEFQWINRNALGEAINGGGSYVNAAAVRASYDDGTLDYVQGAQRADLYYDQEIGTFQAVTSYALAVGIQPQIVHTEYVNPRFIGVLTAAQVTTVVADVDSYDVGDFFINSVEQINRVIETSGVKSFDLTNSTDELAVFLGPLGFEITQDTTGGGTNDLLPTTDTATVDALFADGTLLEDGTKYLYVRTDENKAYLAEFVDGQADFNFTYGGLARSFFSSDDSAGFVGIFLAEVDYPDPSSHAVGDWLFNMPDTQLKYIVDLAGVKTWEDMPNGQIIGITGHDISVNAGTLDAIIPHFDTGTFAVSDDYVYPDSNLNRFMKASAYKPDMETRAKFYGYYADPSDLLYPPLYPPLDAGLWFYETSGSDRGIKRIVETSDTSAFYASWISATDVSGIFGQMEAWVNGVDPSAGAFSELNLHTAFDLGDLVLVSGTLMVFYDLDTGNFRKVESHIAFDLGEIKQVTVYTPSVLEVPSYEESYWSTFSLSGSSTTADEIRNLLMFTVSEQAGLVNDADLTAEDKLEFTQEDGSTFEVDLPAELAGLLSGVTFASGVLTVALRDGTSSDIDLSSLQTPDEYTFVLASEVTQTATLATLAPDPVHTAFEEGHVYAFVAKVANTGGLNVAISGLAEKELLRSDNTSFTGGEIPVGKVVIFTVIGTGTSAILVSRIDSPVTITSLEVEMLLGLTPAEAATLLVDVTKTGGVATITKNDGTTVTITEGSGGSTVDETSVRDAIELTSQEQAALIDDIVWNEDSRTLTIMREGDDVDTTHDSIMITDSNTKHITFIAGVLRFYDKLPSDTDFDVDLPISMIDISSITPTDDTFYGGTVTYTADLLTITCDPVMPLLTAGFRVIFQVPLGYNLIGISAANVDSTGSVVVLKSDGSVFGIRELEAGRYVRMFYDGNAWISDVDPPHPTPVTREAVYPVVKAILHATDNGHITLDEDDADESIGIAGEPSEVNETLSGEFQRTECLELARSPFIMNLVKSPALAVIDTDPIQVFHGTGASRMISIPGGGNRLTFAKRGIYHFQFHGLVDVNVSRATPEIEIYRYDDDQSDSDILPIGYSASQYVRQVGVDQVLTLNGIVRIPSDDFDVKLIASNEQQYIFDTNQWQVQAGSRIYFDQMSETDLSDYFDRAVARTLTDAATVGATGAKLEDVVGQTDVIKLTLPQGAGATGFPDDYLEYLKLRTRIQIVTTDMTKAYYDGRIVDGYANGAIEVYFPAARRTGDALASADAVTVSIGFGDATENIKLSERLDSEARPAASDALPGVIYIEKDENKKIREIRVRTEIPNRFFGITPVTIGANILGYATGTVPDDVTTAGGSIGISALGYLWEEEVTAGDIYKWVVGVQDSQLTDFVNNEHIYIKFDEDSDVIPLFKDELIVASGYTFFSDTAFYAERKLTASTLGQLAIFSQSGVSAFTATVNKPAFDVFVTKYRSFPKEVIFGHQNADYDIPYFAAQLYPSDAESAASRRNFYQDRKFIAGHSIYSTEGNLPLNELMDWVSGTRDGEDVHAGETDAGLLLPYTIWKPKAGKWRVGVGMGFSVGDLEAGLNMAIFEALSGSDPARLIKAETAGATKGTHRFTDTDNTITSTLNTDLPIITDGTRKFYVVFGLSVPSSDVLTDNSQAYTGWRIFNAYWSMKFLED